MDNIPDIVTWAESPAGFYLGETKAPILLAMHQKEILRHILHFQPDGRLPYDLVIWSCPKKSGKTTIGALVVKYFALFFEPPNEIFLCANDLEQSIGRVFKSVARSVKLNEYLANQADVQTRSIHFANGTDVTAIASDYAGAAGSNHGLTVWDELWAYTSESSFRLWDELTPIPTRKISMRFVVTYAGFENESTLLLDLYQRGKDGEPVPGLKHIQDGSGHPACRQNGRTFVYWDHELKSYPGLSITPEEYHAEQRKILRPLAYIRLHENRFTSNESQFVTREQWDACYSPEVRPWMLGDPRELILGVDASTTRDMTAIVGITYNQDTETRDIIYCRSWKPVKGMLRGGKPSIDLEETVKAEILHLNKSGNLAAIYYDPFQLHSIAFDLQKIGLDMIELPQTSARIAADQAFYDAIIGRSLRHFNHPDLNEHIRNVVAVETPRGYRLAKEKTTRKIDLAVAASMAHFGALEKGNGDPWESVKGLGHVDGFVSRWAIGGKIEPDIFNWH